MESIESTTWLPQIRIKDKFLFIVNLKYLPFLDSVHVSHILSKTQSMETGNPTVSVGFSGMNYLCLEVNPFGY